MKSPSYAVIAVLAWSAACAPPTTRSSATSGRLRLPAYISVGSKEGNRVTIRRVPLEEYVEATILSEFAPPSGDAATVERMLELQALLGRTYAVGHLGRHASDGYDLCSTSHCQLYEPSRRKTSKWAPQSSEAARQTAGEVLWFDGAPAVAVFHADCGGQTSRAEDVWTGSGRPYLASITDDGPAAAAHAGWKYDISVEALLRALNADPRTRVGARLDGIAVLARDSAGRAERILLRGATDRTVRGEDFRDALAATLGARAVRSTRFEISQRGTTYTFEGRGFGHGVGLCQAGALARIRAGQKVPAVLQIYFPGTKIVAMRHGA